MRSEPRARRAEILHPFSRFSRMLLKMRSYVACSPSAGRLTSMRTVSPTAFGPLLFPVPAIPSVEAGGIGILVTFFDDGLAGGFAPLAPVALDAGTSPWPE